MTETITLLKIVMPNEEWLNKHRWHRLAKVLWYFSLSFNILYLLMPILENGFSYKFNDFVTILLTSYLFVPITYRIILYIFVGELKEKK